MTIVMKILIRGIWTILKTRPLNLRFIETACGTGIPRSFDGDAKRRRSILVLRPKVVASRSARSVVQGYDLLDQEATFG